MFLARSRCGFSVLDGTGAGLHWVASADMGGTDGNGDVEPCVSLRCWPWPTSGCRTRAIRWWTRRSTIRCIGAVRAVTRPQPHCIGWIAAVNGGPTATRCARDEQATARSVLQHPIADRACTGACIPGDSSVPRVRMAHSGPRDAVRQWWPGAGHEAPPRAGDARSRRVARQVLSGATESLVGPIMGAYAR